MDTFEIVAVCILCGFGFTLQYFAVMDLHMNGLQSMVFPLFMFVPAAKTIIEQRKENKS